MDIIDDVNLRWLLQICKTSWLNRDMIDSSKNSGRQDTNKRIRLVYKIIYSVYRIYECY